MTNWKKTTKWQQKKKKIAWLFIYSLNHIMQMYLYEQDLNTDEKWVMKPL